MTKVRRGRFAGVRSRFEGYQRRVIVWACRSCDWHTEEGKVPVCGECHGADLEHFDSRIEFLRYRELRLMQEAGRIRDLELQPRFPISVMAVLSGKPVKGCVYVADFRYVKDDGMKVVEDCKAKSELADSDVFKLKKRLFEAAYGIAIQIVRR